MDSAPGIPRPTRDELEQQLVAMAIVLQKTLAGLAALQEEARTDALTGLKNRRYLEERLAQELSRVSRSGGHCAVVIIDVNQFKKINDSYGHIVGDTVLQSVAHHLRTTVRQHDVVCRHGGDEFAVLLPDAGPAEAAAAVRRLSRPIENPHLDWAVTLSVGAAVWPNAGASMAELLHQADLDMYFRKRSTANTVAGAHAQNVGNSTNGCRHCRSRDAAEPVWWPPAAGEASP
ncbi:MAG: GGDEF domain-containing protein [Archangium sp.]|nr:GGDEF domain-containing protein [Archangium sp.]